MSSLVFCLLAENKLERQVTNCQIENEKDLSGFVTLDLESCFVSLLYFIFVLFGYLALCFVLGFGSFK